MLREIFLCIPPKPSSLPRASAVCKRWRGLVTDPKFHQQFYAHHRKSPLLGAFVGNCQGTVFAPILDPPDRIPPQRFNFGRYSGRHGRVVDCRHGLVLVKDLNVEEEVAVCDLITGEQHLVTIPSEFWRVFHKGAVLCAATDHVHGRCHSSPFKVVLVSRDERPLACVYSVYSSETGLWGNRISTEAPCKISYDPVVLVGSEDILVFDLDQNSLTVIRGPPFSNSHYGNRQIIQTEDGIVGFGILSYPQMWQMNVNAHGVATFVPWMTVEMHRIPGLPPWEKISWLLGYDEDTNSLFIHVGGNVYVVQLKLMQSMKLYETDHVYRFNLVKSFYTQVTAITGGLNADEMLHIG